MKNIFSNLAAFCLGLSVCVAIIACATDSDDYNNNSIEVLSEQIIKLSERVKELEKSSKNATLPKVVSAESYYEETTIFSKNVDDYTFDEQGRITKITSHYSEQNRSHTYITNITYSDNQCTIKYSGESYTNKITLTFDADDINNVRAVNNMIVSIITERM